MTDETRQTPAPTVSHDIDQAALEAAREIEYFRWIEPEARRIAATQVQIIKAIKACQRPEGER